MRSLQGLARLWGLQEAKSSLSLEESLRERGPGLSQTLCTLPGWPETASQAGVGKRDEGEDIALLSPEVGMVSILKPFYRKKYIY